jgi:hypothetical protein
MLPFLGIVCVEKHDGIPHASAVLVGYAGLGWFSVSQAVVV